MEKFSEFEFSENGFAVLPGFFSGREIDDLLGNIATIKAQRPMNVVVDRLDTGERTLLGLLTPEEIKGVRMKINDLFLTMESVRELALGRSIVPILEKFLRNRPVLCNSLLLERGSAQPPHVDSIYMTPRTQGHLIAIWVALEDAHEDAGRLEYFPGSHKIEPRKFRNDSYHFVPDEMPLWESYMQRKVNEMGLKKETFAAKKGDVFIWHANLLHGGGPIRDSERTRKSLVFHYFSESDSRAQGVKLRPLNGAFWLDRDPQPVSDAIQKRVPFSETAYLKRYKDVADAVKAGAFKSGRHHYDTYGEREGRLPN